jgi:hypothetical protein
MENWRKYLTETNYSGPPLNYSSVVLNDPAVLLREAQRLKEDEQVPPEFIPKEGKWPHHMTINMGPLLPGWENDMPITLVVDGWGVINEDGAKAMAFRVNPDSLDNLPVKNDVPHITAMVPPDGKPFHSNRIVNWQPLEEPFDVTGVVVEQAKQQKKQKPQKQQQKKGPNIRAMAVGMQRGGKSFEEIQAQIKKSTGRDIPIDNIKRMVGA